MNQITNLNIKKPITPNVGGIYKSAGEYYILGQFGGKFFLTNLKSGSTYDGVRDSIDEAFGEDFSKFKVVTEAIVLTPEN